MESTTQNLRRGRVWLWWVAGILGVTLAMIVVLHLLPQPAAEARLAHLRSLGYPTSVAELGNWLPPVPDSNNICLPLLAAARALRSPRNGNVPFLQDSRVENHRGEPWPKEVLDATRAYIADNTESFGRIPEILSRSAGRNPLNYSKGFQMLLPHLAEFKSLAQGLAAKAGLDAEEKRPRDATDDIRAMLATAQGLDDEPILISQLVRIAIVGITCSATERLINTIELADSDLALLQAAFERRAGLNLMVRGLAGEFCFGIEVFEKDPGQVFGLGGTSSGSPSGGSTAVTMRLYSALGLLRRDRAAYTEMMTDFVDLARREPWDQFEPLKQWESRIAEMKSHWYQGRLLTSMLLPALANATAKESSGLAQVRCTTAALAAERFRRRHNGQLPDSLAAIVPDLLMAIPLDPFDGKPLRYE